MYLVMSLPEVDIQVAGWNQLMRDHPSIPEEAKESVKTIAGWIKSGICTFDIKTSRLEFNAALTEEIKAREV